MKPNEQTKEEKMAFTKGSPLAAAMLPLTLCLLLAAGCATNGQKKPSPTGCQAQIDWQVTPDAEITQFDCSQGTYKDRPALIFDATLKNVTDAPKRYRINIFLLDQDKAAGYLVPRKGNPPEVAPGQSETVQVPFINTTEMSKEILVVVKPLG